MSVGSGAGSVSVSISESVVLVAGGIELSEDFGAGVADGGNAEDDTSAVEVCTVDSVEL